MVNFQVAEFIKSAYAKGDFLLDLDQVIFFGKSNVGKSSLINALTNKKNMAYVSKTPGHTKLLNYYLIDHKFYLVDAPGFGYRRLAFEKDNFDKMMDEYLQENSKLKLIVYLLDSRRDISQEEIDVIQYIEELGYHHLIVFTKADKLNQSQKAKLINAIRKLNVENYMFASVNEPRLISQVAQTIVKYVEL